MKIRTIITVFLVVIFFGCKQADSEAKVDPTKMMKDTITAQDVTNNFEKKRDTISVDTTLEKLDALNN